MTVRFELFVKDTQIAADFYTKTLGFTETTFNHERNHRELRRDEVQINIGSISSLQEGHYFLPEIDSPARRGLGVEIVFEVDDIHPLYDQVRKSGYPIHEELRERSWGLTDFRIIDPDGYYLRPTSRK